MIKLLIKLLEELSLIKNQNIKQNRLNILPSFNKKQEYYKVKSQYDESKIKSLVDEIQINIFKLSTNIVLNNPDNDLIIKILSYVKVRDDIYFNVENILKDVKKLKNIEIMNNINYKNDYIIDIKKLNIPFDIKSEVFADINELNRCFLNNCFRASVILCGRILEVCLHRKYYECTGFDLLDKNPGMGLGKLIAKMSEKEIHLDPGIMQQIHLINNVRIYSVHKKTVAFNPSKIQTQAIMLYTKDIITKLF
jgi:hypothetical protein